MRVLGLACVTLLACGNSNPQTPTPDAPKPPADAPQPPVDADPNAITTQELAAIHQLSPLPAVPADTTNAHADDPKAALLGQMLFFDKSYAGPLVVGDDGTNGGLGMAGEAGKVACASCHGVGSQDLDDQRSKPNNVSLGTSYGGRNALGMVNSSFYKWTNWGGRFDSQWSLPLAVAEGPATMASTRLTIAHMLYAKYRTEYNAAFDPDLDPDLDPASASASRFPASGKPGQATFDNMAAGDKTIINTIYANYGKALEAYTRLLVSRDAPFDRFVAGDRTALSASAIRGLKLFIHKGCIGCHSGPAFTDNDFHALGVPQTGPHVATTDTGRFNDVPALLASPFNVNGAFSDDTNTGKLANLAQDASQTNQFRTKGLRNVAMAGPFMHDGAFTTLTDVIEFYNQGGGTLTAGTKDPLLMPLGLSAQDKADLVEFLVSLTGEVIPAPLLADTSK